MANKFKAMKGWKVFHGMPHLIVELTNPRMSAVWPGEPSLGRPEVQLRRLTDAAFTKEDIYALLTNVIEVAESGLSGDDLRLLAEALESCPRKGKLKAASGRAAAPAAAVG